ncbi:MAG: uncharacterized protein A8A55_3519, partial [Amphiamblys sp. WSBS2006]
EFLKTENNSIWMGKVKVLKLGSYAVQILPKLRFHRENELEELSLTAYCSEHIAGMLEMENKNIRIGKVRKISLKGCYAEKIRSKLDFTLMDSREENGSA